MNATSKIEAATLASAMAAAFSEIESATKGNENAAFKNGGKVSKYADLTAVIEAIKPALINHSLFFTQHPEPSDKGVCIETFLHHAGGESLSLGKLFVPANKNDAHGYGSALTYARRYALVTAFGVPVEDDDGNSASLPKRQPEPQLGTIAEADLTKVIQLCEAVGGNQAGRICNAYKIESLPELTESQGKAVINNLERKLAEKAKADTNQEAANV